MLFFSAFSAFFICMGLIFLCEGSASSSVDTSIAFMLIGIIITLISAIISHNLAYKSLAETKICKNWKIHYSNKSLTKDLIQSDLKNEFELKKRYSLMYSAVFTLVLIMTTVIHSIVVGLTLMPIAIILILLLFFRYVFKGIKKNYVRSTDISILDDSIIAFKESDSEGTEITKWKFQENQQLYFDTDKFVFSSEEMVSGDNVFIAVAAKKFVVRVYSKEKFEMFE